MYMLYEMVGLDVTPLNIMVRYSDLEVGNIVLIPSYENGIEVQTPYIVTGKTKIGRSTRIITEQIEVGE